MTFKRSAQMSSRAKGFTIDALLHEHPKKFFRIDYGDKNPCSQDETRKTWSAEYLISPGNIGGHFFYRTFVESDSLKTRRPVTNSSFKKYGIVGPSREEELTTSDRSVNGIDPGREEELTTSDRSVSMIDPGQEEELTTSDSSVSVQLYMQDLWVKFHLRGKEMIVTKTGRRLFPALKVKVSGLDPDGQYSMWVDVLPADSNRYRYVYANSQWMVVSKGDPPPDKTRYLHPDSPASGSHWMAKIISFDKLKLTNNKDAILEGQ
ncbi:T-box transcription factor TBX15-like, partial [Limulus polyphemus]|uniref:T-box transcription factor TBX15-like n=1 Tax=Limulus polyphemus TaxID=6850 RepID=A0ABM1C267_LIMPO